MIDLGAARKNRTKVRQMLSSRNPKLGDEFDELLKLDESHRAIMIEVEVMRAKRNSASQEISQAMAAKDQAKADQLKAEVSELKSRMIAKEAALAESETSIRIVALSIPNIPHESVPAGRDETENPVVRTWGEPRQFSFMPLDHQSVGEKLKMLDLKIGVKLAGSRFALWQGPGAQLIRALGNFLLDRHGKNGYLEVHPPYLALPEILEGTSQLPKFEADMYKTVNMDGDKASALYLISTSEIVLTNMVREEILPVGRLPMKLMALTACFRQ